LIAQGSLVRLWRPPLAPSEWRTWGLFNVEDAEQLEIVLLSMPLRVWRRDTVIPLSGIRAIRDRRPLRGSAFH
jgi:muconolactone delta-isomerase